MDFFEFILIITSVVYALCVAPLLTGFVRILQFDGEIKHFLPQAVFAMFLFLLVPMLWWTIWIFRAVDWHFVTYFYMVIEPAIMFIACSLIFPQRLDHHGADLEDHYYKIRVPLLVSLIVLGFLVFADGVIVGTEAVWHDLRYVQVSWLAILIWALADNRTSVQYGAAIGSFLCAGILLYMGFSVPSGPEFS